jgi:hypothetical protein
MDTTDLLKQAMAAVKAADIPEELQATALQLAVADLRRAGEQSRKDAGKSARRGATVMTKPPRTPSKRQASPRTGATEGPQDGVLARVPDEASFFSAIEKETGVAVADLQDIFHVDDGRLAVKVASKDLGASKKAMAQTVTALLGGAIFAGTSERKLPFSEINGVCDAKHCFDSANAAANIKSTPGFSSIGSRRNQVLLTKSGWQGEFAKASKRVLGKLEPAN